MAATEGCLDIALGDMLIAVGIRFILFYFV